MTKFDFFKSFERKAFEIAEKQHTWSPDSRTTAMLILEEWYDDYCDEHV